MPDSSKLDPKSKDLTYLAAMVIPYTILFSTITLMALVFFTEAQRNGYTIAFLRLSAFMSFSGAVLGAMGFATRQIIHGWIIGFIGFTMLVISCIIALYFYMS